MVADAVAGRFEGDGERTDSVTVPLRSALRSSAIDPMHVVVGPDNRLLQLLSALEARRQTQFLKPDQVTADALVDAELFGLCHIIDVAADNPDSYRFVKFAAATRVAGSQVRRPRFVGDIPVSGFRNFVGRSYAMAKAAAVPLLTDVSTDHLGCRTKYRRLLLPLADDGRKIDKLLVAISHYPGSV